MIFLIAFLIGVFMGVLSVLVYITLKVYFGFRKGRPVKIKVLRFDEITFVPDPNLNPGELMVKDGEIHIYCK